MLETSARLLKLLSLLQSRRSWSGSELAQELEITERTVRRDVEKLRSLGYPVNAASGVAGGYRLGAGAKLPPLLLDDDEALAVSLGLRAAMAGAGAGMEEAALRALDKLRQVLPAGLRKRLEGWRKTLVTSPLAAPEVDPDRLVVLVEACDDRKLVSFDYRDRQGRDTEREVEPHGLVHRYGRWYLVAFDRLREDWRTFRVDRVANPPRVGGSFTPREVPHGDLATYVARNMQAQTPAYEAHVEFEAPLQVMAERLPVGAGQLSPLGPDRCVAEIDTHDVQRFAGYLGSLDVDFVVLDPPELVEAVRSLATRFARAAERAALAPSRSSQPKGAKGTTPTLRA